MGDEEQGAGCSSAILCWTPEHHQEVATAGDGETARGVELSRDTQGRLVPMETSTGLVPALKL